MTNKLYYKDAYLQSFSAKIVDQKENYVVLSDTAFYPTGGGQPHDHGTIDGVAVTNVELIDGEIRHFLLNPISNHSENIEGIIDWKRRFDHMQQHAGQHILTAAFDNLFGFKTVSFHLRKDSATIDLDTSAVSEQQLKEVEQYANQIILENHPIVTKWVTEKELNQYTLRKATAVKEDIRLVIIPDFDYNACGGTHPKETGQVGLIKILQTEKQKQLTRVEFVCGERVITHLHRKQHVILDLISTLSSPEEKLGEAVRTLLENGKSTERQVSELKEVLLQYEAKELMEKEEGTIITSAFQNRSIQELQRLAKILVAESSETLCLLVSENAGRIQIVAAKGNSVDQSMKELITSLLPLFNGKGGGNDAMAQGGGEALLSSEQLLAKSLEFIQS